MLASPLFSKQFSIPISLQSHILLDGSIIDFKGLYTKHAVQNTLYWTEICFVILNNSSRWRFMGVSLNRISTVKGQAYKEELASSIFRSDPVVEIEPPWEAIYTFSETALQSSLGRLAVPYICISSFHEPNVQYYFPLKNFDYQSMSWKIPVSSFSHLSTE